MECNLTMQDVAQIALGVPILTNDNISVLHALIGFLLRKLDCEQDLVTISGFDAMNAVRATMERSTPPEAFIETENELLTLSSMVTRLNDIAEQTKAVENKFKKHLEYIRRPNQRRKQFLSLFWEPYSTPTEDTCVLICADKDFECPISFKLLQQADFILKLKQRSSKPVDDRMLILIERFCKLEVDVARMLEFVEEQRKMLPLIDHCVLSMQHLRMRFRQGHEEFDETIDELAVLIGSKLSRGHYPAIKKYVKDGCLGIMAHIKRLGKKGACRHSSGRLKNPFQCLSCRAPLLHDYRICTKPPCTPNRFVCHHRSSEKPCTCEIIAAQNKFARFSSIGRGFAAKSKARTSYVVLL